MRENRTGMKHGPEMAKARRGDVGPLKAAPRRIRTSGLLFRSQLLYPAELWALCLGFRQFALSAPRRRSGTYANERGIASGKFQKTVFFTNAGFLLLLGPCSAPVCCV